MDLLAPTALREIRLDLTTRCNLRCVYCAVSDKNYFGTDMSEDARALAVKLISDLARHNPIGQITVNGHGETTALAGWEEVVLDLIEAGHNLGLQSNFAKEFSQNELSALARIRNITISIDTSDRKLLRRLRRSVDVRQIVANITAVRSTAHKERLPPPEFSFACGLYDKNTLLLEDFAYFAASLRVARVAFWNLAPHAGVIASVPKEDRVVPLDELPEDELLLRLGIIKKCVQLLVRYGIEVEVGADFVSTLAKSRGLGYD